MRRTRCWMRAGIGIMAVAAWGWAHAAFCADKEPDAGPPREITISPQDRVLVMAPHPDDEVLACAGIIQAALAVKAPVKIVFLTYGDNNEWSFLVYRKHLVLYPGAVEKMGMVRHDEAMAATKLLGLDESDLVFLGYPDFRTIQIWYSHWGVKRPPEVSMLTRAKSVPYEDAFRYGAPYKGEEIESDLKDILRDFKPTKIFVSSPADHNGDHQALYLFLRVALWDLSSEIHPDVYPYLIHMPGWPKPAGKHLDRSLSAPVFLRDKAAWSQYRLTPQQEARKLDAIRKHRSQYSASPGYLLSFIRTNELFGDFPAVFLKPVDTAVPLKPKTLGEEEAGKAAYLTDEEKAAFFSVEEDYVRLQGDDLVFSITLSRPLIGNAGLSLFVFGYRNDAPFAGMPKIQVRFGAIKHATYNQGKKLPADTVKVQRGLRKIVVSIPTALLDYPDRILTSTRTYLDEVPLDWITWREIEISNPPHDQLK